MVCLCTLYASADPSSTPAESGDAVESHIVSQPNTSADDVPSTPESEVSLAESLPESEIPSVVEEPSAAEVSERAYYYEEEYSEDDTPSKIKVKKSVSDTEEEEDDTPKTKKPSAWYFVKNLIFFVPLIIAGLCIFFLVRYNRKVNAPLSDKKDEDPENPSLSSFSTNKKITNGKDDFPEDKDEGSDDR